MLNDIRGNTLEYFEISNYIERVLEYLNEFPDASDPESHYMIGLKQAYNNVLSYIQLLRESPELKRVFEKRSAQDDFFA